MTDKSGGQRCSVFFARDKQYSVEVVAPHLIDALEMIPADARRIARSNRGMLVDGAPEAGAARLIESLAKSGIPAIAIPLDEIISLPVSRRVTYAEYDAEGLTVKMGIAKEGDFIRTEDVFALFAGFVRDAVGDLSDVASASVQLTGLRAKGISAEESRYRKSEILRKRRKVELLKSAADPGRLGAGMLSGKAYTRVLAIVAVNPLRFYRLTSMGFGYLDGIGETGGTTAENLSNLLWDLFISLRAGGEDKAKSVLTAAALEYLFCDPRPSLMSGISRDEYILFREQLSHFFAEMPLTELVFDNEDERRAFADGELSPEENLAAEKVIGIYARYFDDFRARLAAVLDSGRWLDVLFSRDIEGLNNFRSFVAEKIMPTHFRSFMLSNQKDYYKLADYVAKYLPAGRPSDHAFRSTAEADRYLTWFVQMKLTGHRHSGSAPGGGDSATEGM